MRAAILATAAMIAAATVKYPTYVNAGERAQEVRPKICTNHELLKYIRLIRQACNDITCDFKKLKEIDRIVDKPTLLATLQSPYLHPVHIFFPISENRLDMAFDWNSSKRDQLVSLRAIEDPDNSVIFVLGQASAKGSHDLNISLSQQRMAGVMSFLKANGVQCKTFHGAFLGREIFQLSLSDASFLNVPSLDFRNDSYVLNQSVHVFVFPCADLL